MFINNFKLYSFFKGDKVGESLIVEQEPDGRVRNCKVSDWSIWSRCQVHRRGQSCGKGSKKRSRQILVCER